MKLHRFIGNFNLPPHPEIRAIYGGDKRENEDSSSHKDLRFDTGCGGLRNGQMCVSDKEILAQLRNVLRLGVGDQIILADGQRNEAVAKITELGKDFFEVEVLSRSVNANEPDREVVLYCAVLKKENFEWVAQKATEVGVAAVVPIITARTVKLNLKYERLEKIIKEAAEQSGRGKVPKLYSAMNFKEVLEHAANNKANVIFDLSGAKFMMSDIMNLAQSSTIGIFIGPEGGWSEQEIAAAKENGFIIASLGRLTLRAETAAVVAIYLLCNS